MKLNTQKNMVDSLCDIRDKMAGSLCSVCDKLVLQFTVLMLLILVLSQFITVYAENEEETLLSEDTQPLVVSFGSEGKDYGAILSSLFGQVNRGVPESAHTFIQDTDEYRIRIARQIEQNQSLVVLVENLSERLPAGKRAEYIQQTQALEEVVKTQRATMLPVIRDDAFLESAVRFEYRLYAPTVSGFFLRVSEGNPLVNLRELREEVFSSYSELAILYIQIKNIVGAV